MQTDNDESDVNGDESNADISGEHNMVATNRRCLALAAADVHGMDRHLHTTGVPFGRSSALSGHASLRQ